MELSDFLSILDIVVTILIGFVITHTVSVRDTRTRAIKDYYIQELTEIKAEINGFYSDLFKGKLSAKDIIGWNSAIKNRVASFDKAVRKTFALYVPAISKRLFVNHKHITGMDCFNENYSKETIVFDGASKNRIGREERILYEVIERTLYDINNAGARDFFHRKWKEFKSHFYYYRTVKKMSKAKTCFAVMMDWLKSHFSRIILFICILSLAYFFCRSAVRLTTQNQSEVVYDEMPQQVEGPFVLEEDSLVMELDSVCSVELQEGGREPK